MPEVSGFSRPTLAELIDRIQNDINARLPGADSRLRRSVLTVLAFVLAGSVHLLYGFISFIANQVLVDSAITAFLNRHSGIWKIPRKAAAKATGNVTFAGANASVIPEGTVLQRADGAQFVTDEERTISGGTALVPVTAVLPGLAGETAVGAALTLTSPVSGVQTSAVVASGGLGGAADTEADDPLRARVLDRIQAPPHGGDREDYRQWALAVAGVTRAWVFPLELGLGTVVVRFVRDEDAGGLIPDSGEVQAVADYIDPLRPVTADVTVVAPNAAPQNYTIAITPDTAAIRAAIQEELEDFIRREGEPGQTLYKSRINEAISQARGEFDHILTVPAANVVLTSAQIATMGTITWG